MILKVFVLYDLRDWGMKSRFRQFTCGKMSQSWTVKTTSNFKISWEKNLKMATYKIDLTLGYKTFFSWRAGSGLHNGTWAFIDILVEGSTHHQYVARYRICGKSFSAKLRGMKLFTKQETMLWGMFSDLILESRPFAGLWRLKSIKQKIS